LEFQGTRIEFLSGLSLSFPSQPAATDFVQEEEKALVIEVESEKLKASSGRAQLRFTRKTDTSTRVIWFAASHIHFERAQNAFSTY